LNGAKLNRSAVWNARKSAGKLGRVEISCASVKVPVDDPGKIGQTKRPVSGKLE